MTDPTFTLEHAEQRFRVQMKQGEKDYAIYVTLYGLGTMRVTSFPRFKEFVFHNSDPNVVLAIGRLLVAAARKAGASDA